MEKWKSGLPSHYALQVRYQHILLPHEPLYLFFFRFHLSVHLLVQNLQSPILNANTRKCLRIWPYFMHNHNAIHQFLKSLLDYFFPLFFPCPSAKWPIFKNARTALTGQVPDRSDPVHATFPRANSNGEQYFQTCPEG